MNRYVDVIDNVKLKEISVVFDGSYSKAIHKSKNKSFNAQIKEQVLKSAELETEAAKIVDEIESGDPTPTTPEVPTVPEPTPVVQPKPIEKPLNIPKQPELVDPTINEVKEGLAANPNLTLSTEDLMKLMDKVDNKKVEPKLEPKGEVPNQISPEDIKVIIDNSIRDALSKRESVVQDTGKEGRVDIREQLQNESLGDIVKYMLEN